MTTSMEKTLQCECGLEARAENDDGLAAEIQRHAVEAAWDGPLGRASSPAWRFVASLSKRRGLAGSRAKPPNEASGDTQLKEEL